MNEVRELNINHSEERQRRIIYSLLVALVYVLLPLSFGNIVFAEQQGNGQINGNSNYGSGLNAGGNASNFGSGVGGNTDSDGGSSGGSVNSGSSSVDTSVSESSSNNSGGVNAGGVNSGGGSGGTGGSKGGGGEVETTAGNNLSFPTIAGDGFAIVPISQTLFTKQYSGLYVGLTAEEIASLQGYEWYAQKTDGNIWQAGYFLNPSGTRINIFGVDWGDNVESVNPLLGQPFRLEVTLYTKPTTLMIGYNMRALANPSSPDEIQGTNKVTYESLFATVASPRPTMVIQHILDASATSSLVWNGTAWTKDGLVIPTTTISFGPELNVAGKYVYGASSGGWRPVEDGLYRLTFYAPASDISFRDAVVGNLADWSTTTEVATETETGVAKPVIDVADNLTYIDTTVVSGRTGQKPASTSGSGSSSGNTGGGSGGQTSSTLLTASVLSSVDASTDSTNTNGNNNSKCEPYLTDYLSPTKQNNPYQVILLQEFLNETLGTNIPLTGVYGNQTINGVNLLQTTYPDEILKPWVDAGHEDVSLVKGTGNVYVTTLAKINGMKCH